MAAGLLLYIISSCYLPCSLIEFVYPEMPSPVSPVSPMYYFPPPPPPEALRGMPLAPMVGPPAYPYFQALHEPQPDAQPDAEADAEDNHAKLIKQIEFYFRWLLLESIAICRKNRLPLHFY
jgi:hypothetical protein